MAAVESCTFGGHSNRHLYRFDIFKGSGPPPPQTSINKTLRTSSDKSASNFDRPHLGDVYVEDDTKQRYRDKHPSLEAYEFVVKDDGCGWMNAATARQQRFTNQQRLKLDVTSPEVATNEAVPRPPKSPSAASSSSGSGSTSSSSGIASISTGSEPTSIPSASSSSMDIYASTNQSDLPPSENADLCPIQLLEATATISESVNKVYRSWYMCGSSKSTNCVIDIDDNRFQNFITCIHSGDISRPLSDVVTTYYAIFVQRIKDSHTAEAPCFAASELFFIQCHDQPFQLYSDFVLLPLPVGSALPNWLRTQLLGSHFNSERQKRAAWALETVPISGYISQTWTAGATGNRRVVDLQIAGRCSVSPLAQMKMRLYHPANLSITAGLMEALNEPLLQACMDSVEEWLICIHFVMSTIPDVPCEDPLHSCNIRPCPHIQPNIDEISRTIAHLDNALFFDWVNHQGYLLTPARLYWLMSTYILLQPTERVRHDEYCRFKLNTARSQLADAVAPHPALAQAAEIRGTLV
ncbi:hypothetical protein DL96DRAFT_1583963 [Flagelloscypha sp. PMI_526]|nr:hypothetical protein DL96DRAFT_1583963 [Flagelloscypha sp. PMI_526]